MQATWIITIDKKQEYLQKFLGHYTTYRIVITVQAQINTNEIIQPTNQTRPNSQPTTQVTINGTEDRQKVYVMICNLFYNFRPFLIIERKKN